MGSARAFYSPAMSAMLPQIVSGEEFPRAVAASSSAFQICTIVGPAIGGLIYAVNSTAMFAVVTGLCLLAASQTLRLVGRPSAPAMRAAVSPDESIFAGLRYVKSNRLLLSLISLDLFAVLLGGVTALLPIYAKDIIVVGPIGLGCTRGRCCCDWPPPGPPHD
jgi:MFS family permease